MLVIGEQGSVAGEVKAETVSVLGTVKGQITAQAVALARTARILGDITHDTLSVEAGAYVEGRFNRHPPLSGEPAALLGRTAAEVPGKQGDAEAASPPAAPSPPAPSPPKVVLIGN